MVCALLKIGCYRYPKNTISKQLRYAIEFSSKELTGSLLLVEEFGWIEIYFNGIVCDGFKICNVIEEAIAPCAGLLGYKPSALQYDLFQFTGTYKKETASCAKSYA